MSPLGCRHSCQGGYGLSRCEGTEWPKGPWTHAPTEWPKSPWTHAPTEWPKDPWTHAPTEWPKGPWTHAPTEVAVFLVSSAD